MRPIFILISSFLFGSFCSLAQSKADDPTGEWTFAKKDGRILLYQENQKYFGKVIWGNEPDRKDLKNPDPKLRNQKIIGSLILKNFTFNGKDKLEGGTVYDPNNGKIYSCIIRLKNEKTLEVRGYIGISLFGRTEIWTR